MSDLLTHEEYQSIAAGLVLPSNAFIDGRFQASRSKKKFATINPATGETLNCYGEGDIKTPFGGYKQSGFGGRDNSLHAHDQYTEPKTIWIDLSDRVPGDSVDQALPG